MRESFSNRPASTQSSATSERDRALTEGLCGGDPEAFDAAVREYWPRLIAYATRLLDHTRGQADDVVQEALVRLWEHRRELRPSTGSLPYLYRLVRNLALDECRQHTTRRRWLESDSAQPRHPATPLEVVEVEELRMATARAIDRLPPRRREVFVLAHLHDLSYREIADIMGISSQTVANQLSAALADLRASLGAFLTESLDPAHR